MTGLEVAAILGATQLLGGLLGQKAQAEQQRKAMLASGAQQQQQLEMAGIQQATQGQQSALSNLVEAYRNALVGG